jgi:DNA-binding response OmpR family regulator
MPGRDGFWLISQIRRIAPAARAVAISGVADIGAALKAGFQGYVAKPPDPLELCGRLSAIVRR